MSTTSVSPRVLATMRVAAVLIALGTVAFLFIGRNWRADNAFLVPDLVLAVVLLFGAALPSRVAVHGLLAGFSFAAGVLGAASMTYVVDGRVGPGATAGFAAAVVAAAVLLAVTMRRTA